MLADTYSGLRRHEVARASELLQSQLLQPLNVTPIQPQLAESDLRILEGAGPAEPAFNEFNPLFSRNGFIWQGSSIVGSNRTFGDEVTHSGLQGRFAYSLGQFHYKTDGYRSNNDLEHDIYNAFGQWAISPNASVQVELRHQGTENGDLNQSFNPNQFELDERTVIDRETARLGLHYRPSNDDDVLASASYRDFTNSQSVAGAPDKSRTGAYGLELQYQKRLSMVKLIFGAGHVDRDRTLRPCVDQDPTTGACIEFGNLDRDAQYTNAYVYSGIDLFRNLNATLGLSYAALDRPGVDRNLNRLNPKAGVIWQLLPDTTLRAAWFRAVKGVFAVNTTIEPSQVAGFNQLFDDADGTKSERYGVALDQVFSPQLYAGLEFSWRELERPFGAAVEERTEHLHRGYLYWTPSDYVAFSAEYFLDRFDRDLPIDSGSVEEPVLVTTHRIPLTFSYYRPSGFFSQLTVTHVNQDVEIRKDRAISALRVPKEDPDKRTFEQINDSAGIERFWLVDAALGYRLPSRWGIVAVGVNNLFDTEFRFQESNFNQEEPVTPLYQPDRTLYAQFTVSF